jgi:DNA-binding SARP family transcriptional activator
MSTLQTYILQIRRILKSAGRRNTQAVLVTKTPGYQLLGQEKLDRTAFTELADLGREAAATGQDRQASVLLSEALAMWRGPALADVRVGPMATAHVIELEECRMSVLDRRVEADLRLGRHRELLDELDMLIERHPTHENLRAQHMLALYRAGERSRALGDYHNVRRLLNDTLGIEPMPRLRRLYRAVLLNDPYLVAGTAGPELVSPDSTAVIPPPRTGEPA